MKYHILLLLIIGCFYSCGGVVGSIEKYEFEHSTFEELKVAVNKVFDKYPELQKPDNGLYGHRTDEDTFYFLVNHDKKQYVLNCSIIKGYNNVGPEISLTSGVKMGEVMKLASNMSYKEKNLYRSLFENILLTKIKNEL